MGGSFWNGELDTPLQTMCILHVNSSNRIICSIHDLNFIMADKKNVRASLFWVLRKKETFACTIFSKICYVTCAINRADKLICLCACLPAWTWLHESHWQACYHLRAMNLFTNCLILQLICFTSHISAFYCPSYCSNWIFKGTKNSAFVFKTFLFFRLNLLLVPWIIYSV